MKVLFDQNVPRPLASLLVRHGVTRAAQLHWEDLKNGELIQAAEEGGFDVLVTADRSLGYQQNLTSSKLAIVVLPSGRWPELEPFLPAIIPAIDDARGGTFLQLPAAHAGRS